MELTEQQKSTLKSGPTGKTNRNSISGSTATFIPPYGLSTRRSRISPRYADKGSQQTPTALFDTTIQILNPAFENSKQSSGYLQQDGKISFDINFKDIKQNPM